MEEHMFSLLRCCLLLVFIVAGYGRMEERRVRSLQKLELGQQRTSQRCLPQKSTIGTYKLVKKLCQLLGILVTGRTNIAI
ncbi:hypothetical protein KSP39_PZI020953 [Platanthera zijinensis]|uniref:Uncharacterized protein n=1 Tax=Platanthera zijinensis TaxID=2320716 RepID=A0AAP0AYM3_9ASPA